MILCGPLPGHLQDNDTYSYPKPTKIITTLCEDPSSNFAHGSSHVAEPKVS